VGQLGPALDVAVPALDERAVRHLALVAAHDGAARGVHHAPDAGAPGGLEDVAGADHVRAQDRVEGRARTDRRGQVDDDVDALEGGPDGLEVTDVGLVTGHARHRAPVQGAQLVRRAELPPQRRADQPAHAGHQNLHGAVSYIMTV
jgi:hypothetical protein